MREASLEVRDKSKVATPRKRGKFTRRRTCPLSREKHRLTSVLAVFTKARRQFQGEKYRLEVQRAFRQAIRIFGDRCFTCISKDDVQTFIAKELGRGVRTGGVKNTINLLHAGVRRYMLEKRLTGYNPFSPSMVPNLGVDRPPNRIPARTEIAAVRSLCVEMDDDIRWLLAMLVDTGARVSEIAGLAIEDLKINDDVPHIVIREHPWRRLKSRFASRHLPLTGVALWAARRVLASAPPSQPFAFPRYIKSGSVTSTAAGAIATWLRTRGFEHDLHSLRVAVIDRLRASGCPADVRASIAGLKVNTIEAQYGYGYSLTIMRRWLERSTDTQLRTGGVPPRTIGYDRDKSAYMCAMEVIALIQRCLRPSFRELVATGAMDRIDIIRGLRYARLHRSVALETAVPASHDPVYVTTDLPLPPGTRAKRRRQGGVPTYDYRKLLLALPRPSRLSRAECFPMPSEATESEEMDGVNPGRRRSVRMRRCK
ncbi:tyrosine-type recombinase/integrase [Cupriavidus phytorum]|uniref:tyrosine-type recombinase/integrase n=1 Tax=Cupriavidus phytorum TaxID=3024399 RepID=UPI000E2FF27F